MICSDGKIEKEGKMAKKEETKETEETPVVEIHINCPASKTDSRQSQVELKQDTEIVETRSFSVEVLDIESSEKSLPDASLVLSEDDCDIEHPQDPEEDFSLEVQGKSCLPRNVTVTGLAQQNGFQGCALAPVEEPACCSSWNENQLPRKGNGNSNFGNWAMERSGSSGIQGAPKISLPLPPPSLWQQVYSKTLKKREQMVQEKLQRKMQGRPKKKTIARMSGVDTDDCHENSSDNSSSGASSRLTSAASRHSSITSDKDLKNESSENSNNGQKDGRKSRKWFRLAHNKVAPL